MAAVPDRRGLPPRFPPTTPLGRLAGDELQLLLSSGTRRSFRAGATLLLEGDTTRHVLLLCRGFVRLLSANDANKPVLLGFLSAGDLAGEWAALDGRPRSATVTAVREVDAVEINDRTFARIRTEHPQINAIVVANVTDKARRMVRHRVGWNRRSIRSRVALILLDLADRYGEPAGPGGAVAVRITQAELAYLADGSLTTVEKALRGLRADDVLRTEYSRIVIVDPDRLQAEAAIVLPAD